jgi:hypothetical protein
MSRRARAIGFGIAALVAAVIAGTIADGYGDSVARGYGSLRPVVVTAAQLPAGRALDPTAAETSLEVRRRSRAAPTCSPRSFARRARTRRGRTSRAVDARSRSRSAARRRWRSAGEIRSARGSTW